MKHEPRKKKQMVSRLPLGHRALALLLALLMVFTATGMQVFADEDSSEPVAEETQTETTVVTEPEPTTEQTNTEETPATTEQTNTEETPATTEQTNTEETPATTEQTNTEETPATTETTETPAETSEEPAETASDSTGSAEETGTTPDPYDITNKITESAMTVSTDGGDTYQDYTKLDSIPLTASVKVTMDFKEIDDILPNQVLVYQIPSDFSVNTVLTAQPLSYTYQDSTGATQSLKIGTYTIDQYGKITIVPDETFLNEETGKIVLPGGHIAFSGMLGWDVEPGDLTITLGKSDPISITVTDEEEEPVAASAPKRAQARAASGTYDITDYLTTDSYINVIIDDDEYSLADLTSTGKQVPEGAGVHVKLAFESIKNIPEGDTLTYQIPKALVVQAVTKPTKLLDAKTSETLGSFVIDENGLITVTIDDSYHDAYEHKDTQTLDLEGFNLFFYGSFSDDMGKEDGSDDNKISFSGSASSTGLTFTIPFDYLNDHANVQIDKNGEFTSATTIKYTVTVTAPTDNSQNAYNVVVTDKITSAVGFVEAEESTGNVYRNAKVTNGSFDAATGVWTIDGEMTPGQTETLTYELQVSDEYYTGNTSGESVCNTATVTFNECGKNNDVNELGAPGTVLLTKNYNTYNGNPLMVNDDQGTYLTYTLTATAYGAAQDGIVVKDAFTTPDYISYIVAEEGYQGTVTLGTDQKSLTWNVGSLEADTSATLTYRAYLNANAWVQGASYDELFEVTRVTKNIYNTASVSVNNNGTAGSDEPLVTSTKTSKASIQKAWLRKTSNKITSGEHKDAILFTIKANEAPAVDNILTIWDKLTDGTYEENGLITINRYSYSTNNVKLKDSTTVNVADVLDSGSTTSWTIDLQKVPKSDGSGTVDLSGAYYYEVSYYVVATGISVTNQAGIGFGNGGFDITKVAQGTSGWTYGDYLDFSKSNTAIDYETGEDKWTITLRKTIPAGMAVLDTLSTQFVYSDQAYWFNSDSLDSIVVKQGSTVLELDKDYTVELVQDTSDGNYQKYPVAPEVRSHGIQINFLHEIQVNGSSDYVTIDYSIMIDTTAYSASTSRNMWIANWVGVKLPVYGELQAQGQTYVGAKGLSANYPLSKTGGTYHADSGTITWDIKVNQKSSVGGDATLIDLLPEGLTFVSAEITDMGDAAKLAKTTVNGKTVGDTIEAADCEVDNNYTENGTNYTKVTFSVENLSRFQAVDNDKLVSKTDSYTENGMVTIQITAKVDAGLMASLSEATKVTNKAILTDNDYLPTDGVNATCDATIPATGSTVISKSQASKESPAYVQFALDINSKALDLVADDGSLTIDDVMGTGMTMATSHENCFQVYDVKDVTDLYNSDGTVNAEQAATGENITGQCSWEAATDKANTYRITVPDSTHAVIVYWAAYSGVEGQKVSLSNNAYFYYEGQDYSNNSSKWSAKLQVSGAGGSAYSNPYFYLQKVDQWGNNISGAKFDLYEYNPDGEDTYVTTVTTENGKAYVGHRSETSFSNLKLNTVYVLKEAYAPAGYKLDDTKHYFEFIKLTGSGDEGEVTDADIQAHQATHPQDPDITVVDMSPGGTYTLTNTFTGASLTIPIVKTINGKNLSSTTEFSFTLKQTKGDPAYTDSVYKTAVPSTGLTTTITGSGSDAYDLYFKSTGDYTFTVTENDLSDTAKKCGYTEKDSTTYTVDVKVESVDGVVTVTSATYTTDGGTKGDLKNNGSVLTFNNKLSLEGSLNLKVKKTVSGRTQGVQAGEFSFNVLKNGKIITDSDGKELVFRTQEDGLVDITIPLTQDDIGTQDFVIKEIVPTGSAADPSISYEAVSVIATVTISEIPATGDKTASVAATSDVTYTAEQTDTNGVPLMVNKYSATGSITLEGSKIFTQAGSNKSVAIGEKQFTFTVKEGNTVVATGYTETNGDITFTPINYIQTDVGPHTYTITEDSYTTPFIDFSDETYTVKVNVTDLGGGKLKAEVDDSSDTVIFHNTATTLLPTTGIRLDVLPYVLILILALGCGALMLRRRKHTKG